MRRALIITAALVIATIALTRAAERVDESVFWKIRQEGTTNSQILRTVHMLTDVYGPRLTGSPNLKAAGEWAVQQMQSWGLANGRLEPWEFGHVGWQNERLAAHIVSPVKDALVAEVLAWTPSTAGLVRAQAMQITIPERPTKASLTAHLDSLRAAVKGKIVLVGAPVRVPVTFAAASLRRDDAEVSSQMAENVPAPAEPPASAGDRAQPPLNANQITEQINDFLVAAGAALRVNDAGRDHGQIRAFHNRTFDLARATPTVVMRNEDYGRISRLLADGRSVELEFEIVNRTYPEGRTAYNVVAEIPGTDKADEVVMLGGHLDSWHAATGATDNAVGCAVMMEAARILTAVGVKPRRTIRVALWSGEEQGLLGSQAYVKAHFGTAEAPKPEFAKFAGYFNIDSGTGRARGMTVFGPPAAATILREATASFVDLGLLGVRATRSRVRGGTDSTSFNEAGLPGVGILQDPIEYQSYTWHTNLDTYERIVEDDVKKSAIVIAAAVYHVAMRDEMLPRFAPQDMPRLPRREDAPAATPAATQTATVTAAARPLAIDAARMTAHVKVLASDEFEGRGPATAGETKTIDYLVAQFKALGVQPGGAPDASGARGWTQDVPLAQADVAAPLTASVTVGTRRRDLKQGDDIAIRATQLPATRVTVASAPIVFVGYGVSAPERKWDDFKGVDLKGKIALVLVNDPDFEADLNGRFDGKAMTYYGRWTYKFEEAARKGALGMLVIHETDPASYGWATVKNSNTITMIDIVRPDQAAVHPAVEGWIQRNVAVDLFTSAGLDFEAEKKKAQRADFRPVTLATAAFSLDYAVKQARIVSKNVVGRIEGRTRPNETIIYTAHWDHLGVGLPDERGDRIYNGARDNALGIASLLEIARVWAASPKTDRSVVFLALTSEEKGLLGSEFYAQSPLYPLATTAAVYNMDGGSTWGPSNDVAIAGEGKISLQRDLAMAARVEGREFSPDPRPEAGGFFRSDHFPFAKVGVPAISFRAGQDLVNGGVAAGKKAADEYNQSRYHQPGDEWSPDWDLTGAAQDAALLLTIGRDLANSRRWAEWDTGSEFKTIRDSTAAARR
jgi:Zn-dependent M28 family amino/carboxypeptidase